VSLTDRTDPSQTATISLELDLPHPPEKVWRALTDPALLAQWLLPVFDLDLEAGATFTFRREPIGGWDGVVHCRVLEIEAQSKLRYTWVVGDMHTVVTFTLTPSTSGTVLSIEHSGFEPEQKRNFAGARYGWKTMGGKLVDVLAGSP
jgi:uncharacterized protein YndB with AHSA1/START domain